MNKRIIVAASNNRDKIKEIKEILKDHEILSLLDMGIESEAEENGDTFEENAIIKAREAKKFTDNIVIADDSGLMVDHLNGLPGVHSKRFSALYGDMKDDAATSVYDKNNALMLKMMMDVEYEKRTACFVCATALIMPDNTCTVFVGKCRGHILNEQRGKKGFGYDPIFCVDGLGKTFAELNEEEKNSISHRAISLMKVKEFLND
jgi:XTP/dITP diphosphohydrolase